MFICNVYGILYFNYITDNVIREGGDCPALGWGRPGKHLSAATKSGVPMS